MNNDLQVSAEAPPPASRKTAHWRTLLGHREIWLFMFLLISFAYFFPRWASWNQNSRLDLTMAIVEEGTVAIDNYVQNTGDYAMVGDHYYSTKAPGSSLLEIPQYWIFRNLFTRVRSSSLSPVIRGRPQA